MFCIYAIYVVERSMHLLVLFYATGVLCRLGTWAITRGQHLMQDQYSLITATSLVLYRLVGLADSVCVSFQQDPEYSAVILQLKILLCILMHL
jgi:hypothetical protein